MKDRHLRLPRKPRGGRLVSWARVPASKHSGPGARFTEYRLFRRDLFGAWHFEFRRFTPDAPRHFIARELRLAKRSLRDRVDELDLARMEGEPA